MLGIVFPSNRVSLSIVDSSFNASSNCRAIAQMKSESRNRVRVLDASDPPLQTLLEQLISIELPCT